MSDEQIKLLDEKLSQLVTMVAKNNEHLIEQGKLLKEHSKILKEHTVRLERVDDRLSMVEQAQKETIFRLESIEQRLEYFAHKTQELDEEIYFIKRKLG